MAQIIPDSSEPVVRDGRNSGPWYRFFEELTRAYNTTSTALAGAVAAVSDVWAATPDKTFTTGLIESASALVAITETQLINGVDWDTFVNADVAALTANRLMDTPDNGQPGTWRTLYVVGNNATPRALTFHANFKGDVPSLTDITSTKGYLLMVFCKTATHYVVSAKRAL